MSTEPRINDLAAFMKARHNIYLKRLAGWPGPWTDDPVLRDGRFCNVFRELDTVTVWIRKNIREPFADHPHLWFMLAIARYINWPDTLETLMHAPGAWPSHDDFSPENMTQVLEAKASWGDKVYTGAYMIRAESNPNAEWYSWTKHRYIAEIVLGRLWEDRDRWAKLLSVGDFPGEPVRLEEVWSYFQSPYYIGWGPFMAYEVVTDLRHTRYLRDAPDIYTWANAGPGAIRGLNYLCDRPETAKPSAKQTNDEMLWLMKRLNGLNEPGFNQTFGPPGLRFEMRDVEHSLCEIFKWQRGYTRSRYDWTRAKPL